MMVMFGFSYRDILIKKLPFTIFESRHIVWNHLFIEFHIIKYSRNIILSGARNDGVIFYEEKTFYKNNKRLIFT